jgi:hypothetical protein
MPPGDCHPIRGVVCAAPQIPAGACFIAGEAPSSIEWRGMARFARVIAVGIAHHVTRKGTQRRWIPARRPAISTTR